MRGELLFELRHTNAREPRRIRSRDAAYDLFCVEGFRLWPMQRRFVDTGIAIAMPDGVCGLVIPRSGLAARHGLTIVNAPGLIDPGYRGNIGVVLLNTGWRRFRARAGDRIAQLLLLYFAEPAARQVEALPEGGDARGDGGFGSSGR